LAAGTLTLALLVLVTVIAFSSPAHYWYTALPLAMLLPALLAAYCSPVFAAAAALTLGSAVVWTTTFGIGEFGEPLNLHDRAYAARATLLAISACTLLLAALFAERRHKEAALARDISDRKKAEAALAERTMQLAVAGRAALVGSFAYDVDTERLQITPGYAAIHGFPDGTTEIARCEWQAGMHPEDRVRWEALRSGAYREQWQEYSGEYRIVRSGNEVRWIEARVFVSYASDGRPQRAVGIDIDVTARKRADEQQRTLNAELDHRVKNVLATVSAIITQTPKTGISLADFVAGFDGRIKSLARTHELLSRNHWQDVALAEVVRREIVPYAAGNATILGPGVTLKAAAAQAVATVLHELATNAAKYGSFSRPSGRLFVGWCWLDDGSQGRVAIQWRESGGPAVSTPTQTGFGTSVIRELIPFELGGTVDLTFARDGLQCRLEIPADWVSSNASRGVELEQTVYRN
jgi:two-component sensor histidine kinase